MSSYLTGQQETFQTIARKVYGSELSAAIIEAANPGVADPLPEGKVLIVPAQPGAPQNAPQDSPTNDENEVSITVNGVRFRFWTTVEVRQSIDRISSFSFSAPFTPEDEQLVNTFRPFQYQDVQISVGGEPLFTGTLINIIPSATPNSKTLSVSGYSLPGVLGDCTPPKPSNAYQLEFENSNIVDIATALVAPFGISVSIKGTQEEEGDEGIKTPPGRPFPRVQIEPKDNIFQWLTNLAKQRSILITSDERGRLIFQISDPFLEPVANLIEGASPLVVVSASFRAQQYFTHITALEPVIVGLKGGSFTAENPHSKSRPRPHTFMVPDTQGTDVELAATSKMGRMFANMAAYVVTVPTWRDAGGALWEPDTLINLLAPGAMIRTPYTFLIKDIIFSRNGNAETASLDLVFPGVFSGEVPEVLPWDS